MVNGPRKLEIFTGEVVQWDTWENPCKAVVSRGRRLKLGVFANVSLDVLLLARNEMD